MEISVKCEHTLLLCQGCLSADRKLLCITGHIRALFIKLREDSTQSVNDTKELLLCWECVAVLNKMKHFQARIKTAQHRLVQYLHTLYNNDNLLHTLSCLKKSKHKDQYDYKYEYIYEEKHKDLIPEQNRLDQRDLIFEQNGLTSDQKDLIFEQNGLTLDQKDLIYEQKEYTDNENVEIKIENNEIIKEDYDDMDYYEPELKEETDEDITTDQPKKHDNISTNKHTDYYKPELKTDEDFTMEAQPKKRKKIKYEPIKKYEKYVTITKTSAPFTKRFHQFYETVHLNEEDVEQILNRIRKSRRDRTFPYKCELCRCRYLKRLDYLRHKTFHHCELQFPNDCLVCKREVISHSHLHDHWKEYHNSMLRCTLCGEMYNRIGEIVKHLNRMHTKTFSCNSCPNECSSLREFSNHYKMAHERVVCDYCNKSVISKQKLEKHIIKNHLPQRCKICNRDYSSYHTYETHLRGYHPELLESVKKTDLNKEMRYCVECDRQYPSIVKYKIHLKQSPRHTPKEKVRVPCPACDKVFSRVLYKNNHYRLVHSKQSKHYCELCDKYFANGYGVRKHIQFVHEKRPPPRDKICDLCGRGFTTNRILINHRRTHTGERPFKCQYCPATFAQQVAQKSHQKTQHKNILITS